MIRTPGPGVLGALALAMAQPLGGLLGRRPFARMVGRR